MNNRKKWSITKVFEASQTLSKSSNYIENKVLKVQNITLNASSHSAVILKVKSFLSVSSLTSFLLLLNEALKICLFFALPTFWSAFLKFELLPFYNMSFLRYWFLWQESPIFISGNYFKLERYGWFSKSLYNNSVKEIQQRGALIKTVCLNNCIEMNDSRVKFKRNKKCVSVCLKYCNTYSYLVNRIEYMNAIWKLDAS